MGYGAAQLADLADTIAAVPCDVVLIASPVDLRRLIRIVQPCCRLSYEFEQTAGTSLAALLRPVVEQARTA
jgi:predicted GTPase